MSEGASMVRECEGMEEGTQLWMRVQGWCEGGAGVVQAQKGCPAMDEADK